MNPELDHLQPYPFQRLAQLKMATIDMAGGYIWFHDYRPQPELDLGEYDRLRRAVAQECVALAAVGE